MTGQERRARLDELRQRLQRLETLRSRIQRLGELGGDVLHESY